MNHNKMFGFNQMCNLMEKVKKMVVVWFEEVGVMWFEEMMVM